jgi:hypothetical protein
MLITISTFRKRTINSDDRKRWLLSLQGDVRIMWVRRWWEMGCGEDWGSFVREAKAHPGLQRQGKRKKNNDDKDTSPLSATPGRSRPKHPFVQSYGNQMMSHSALVSCFFHIQQYKM